MNPADRTLWRAKKDGSERRQLTLPPLRVGPVRWSPNGSRLAFAGGQSSSETSPETSALYVVSREGGAPEVASEPGPVIPSLCWMPDGKTLIWNRDGVVGPIMTFNTETKEHGSLGDKSEGMQRPTCSRSGLVLAMKGWFNEYQWWVYHPDTGAWEDLGPAVRRPFLLHPNWSRDGTGVYGLSLDERAIYRYDLRRRLMNKVADLGLIDLTALSFSVWMGLDPEDAPIILRQQGIWDIYVLDWEAP